LPIAIFTLDTGRLHEETYRLMQRVEQRYGRCVRVLFPQSADVERLVAAQGVNGFYQSVAQREACCAVRKLEPLQRLLAGRTAWVTGLRREQSDGRAVVPFSQTGSDGRIKLNPLADWSWADVWHYIAANAVPYNALHDEFYPSIGCAPCTRAIAAGEPFRSGRWWWEDDKAKECGLHVKTEGVAA
jgi:phosphoadenosine phosphosulfate reductase